MTHVAVTKSTLVQASWSGHLPLHTLPSCRFHTLALLESIFYYFISESSSFTLPIIHNALPILASTFFSIIILSSSIPLIFTPKIYTSFACIYNYNIIRTFANTSSAISHHALPHALFITIMQLQLHVYDMYNVVSCVQIALIIPLI